MVSLSNHGSESDQNVAYTTNLRVGLLIFASHPINPVQYDLLELGSLEAEAVVSQQGDEDPPVSERSSPA